MAQTKRREPDPIDVHVGDRVRIRRILLGLSQTALAGPLGLTFQQVQKYERGTNRISASVLYKIAGALNVDLRYFFEGLTGEPPEDVGDLKSRETLDLVRNYNAIDNPNLQKKIYALVKAVGAIDPSATVNVR